MTAAIEVEGLRMRYRDTDVLTGVDLSVHPGEVVVLLGPNGAGKTTTVETLEGFRAASGGRVQVLGTDPLHADEAWRARVGVVLQSWRDHGKWRVGELLTHLGRYYTPFSTPQRARPREAGALLETVGLMAKSSARVGTLSGGERRRLDVAIGIVGCPEVLFLDEPTAGLDPEGRRAFHDLVHGLADSEDTAILLTTHDLDEAEKLADRILILHRGRIVASGSAEDLARRAGAVAEVRWSRAGERFVHAGADATAFVRQLFTQYGETITDLEVRRACLEDTYIAMVTDRDTERGTESAPGLQEVSG